MPAAKEAERPAIHAQWMTPTVLAINPAIISADPNQLVWKLLWSEDGGLRPTTISRLLPTVKAATLRVKSGGLPDLVLAKHPHLKHYIALELDGNLPAALEQILQGQVVLASYFRDGTLTSASPVCLAPVIDGIFVAATAAKYGVTLSNGVPTLRLWAPTAKKVALKLWRNSEPEVLPMIRNADGSWSIDGSASWLGARYRYLVTVFMPCVGEVRTNEVTDPYSVGLTTNSTHSLILDLEDPALAPDVWRDTPSPVLDHPVDQVIYELHVRDFSMADKTIPQELRGTYLAFTQDGFGRRHLQRLSRAGLTSVQLLPIADFATVEENRERHALPSKNELKSLPPDSPRQQEIISALGEGKAFNWGYDPWHYQVPEGSFASAGADGRQRIVECRQMIGSLHEIGLRVILDQVFNHTAGAGLDHSSVFDRIVPGYYYRIDDNGKLACSTCCPNIATEHRMAEKLMVDSVLVWAKYYKVDGFRFDLMGHHSVENMLAVRAALDTLTLDKDAVDGVSLTMHGEGWNFGEVANDSRFRQARQGNLGGTGIATFSDRLRDAVRGGGPFDSDPRAQGFGSGLMLASNGAQINGSGRDQHGRLTYFQDLIQLGLAGNLREFEFGSQHLGRKIRGHELGYHGQAAAYADQPDEVVTYVDAHDNETLFDALTVKLHLATTMPERVRMNTLCLALATLGQSPVMWHAGTDFLRSKSCDRNSYNSGDWFNYLDFSMKDNGFRAGLPPAADNFESWPYVRPFLARPGLKPLPHDMARAHRAALELLMLRQSSPLFRLRSAELIQQKVQFPTSNTWVNVPGVIVMLIDDTVGEPVDERHSAILVVFNGTPRAVHQRVPMLRNREFKLSPIQQESMDHLLHRAGFFPPEGVLTVPARCVAVFVENRDTLEP